MDLNKLAEKKEQLLQDKEILTNAINKIMELELLTEDARMLRAFIRNAINEQFEKKLSFFNL